MHPFRFTTRVLFSWVGCSLVGLLAATGSSVQAQPASSATFTLLPSVDGSSTSYDYGLEVTNQGYVAGYAEGSAYRAVRWEPIGAVTGLGAHPSYPHNVAHSLSGTGQIVCGIMYDASFEESQAFIWTQAQGIRLLPDFDKSPVEGRVVSDDGSTIWGIAESNFAGPGLAKWDTNTLDFTGIWQVGDFPVQVGALDCSADGRIAVGFETTQQFGQRSVRVTPSGISFLPKMDGRGNSVAYGTTPDGSIVIGYGEALDGNVSSFIWSERDGIRNLPRLKPASTASRAFDIAENLTIVGHDLPSNGRPEGEVAMLWIAERPFALKDYLQTYYGVDTSDWRAIQAIRSISRNGRALAGYGLIGGRTRAFRVQLFGNLFPVANAGEDVRKNDAAPGGVNVKLDGRKSVDPDGEPLTFRWSGIRFENNTAVRPTAKFPVGTTTVTLKVTDAANVSSTDTVRVIVKAKRSKIRPQGLAANEAFAGAATLTATANSSGETNEAALVAAENAALADALGTAIGDAFVWGEDEAPEEAAADYAALRLLQSAYGRAAASSLAQAYAETGDSAYAEAYRSTATGVARAFADLAEEY